MTSKLSFLLCTGAWCPSPQPEDSPEDIQRSRGGGGGANNFAASAGTVEPCGVYRIVLCVCIYIVGHKNPLSQNPKLLLSGNSYQTLSQCLASLGGEEAQNGCMASASFPVSNVWQSFLSRLLGRSLCHSLDVTFSFTHQTTNR